MQKIISDLQNGNINISDMFDISAATYSVDSTPYLYNKNDEYTISFINLENINSITNFKYNTIGTIGTRYLTTYYRISNDGFNWTTWYELNSIVDNFPIIDSNELLNLDIKWIRSGSSNVGSIRILDYSIDGILERNLVENVGDCISTININSNENIIWKAPFIYKVFKITDIETIPSDLTNIDIKYRYSQDNSRSWSEWEPFTKENITTKKINPIRFFQIEYSITNRNSANFGIQDINLIGNFQNISKDYFKTNLYGIRECCLSSITGYYDKNGNYISANNTDGNTPNGSGNGISKSGGQCDNNGMGSTLPITSDQDKANFYSPYQQNEAMDLLNKLSADAESIFGHRVIYFVTDPDIGGQDSTLHEYQLYNVVCKGTIKVAVENNSFPDSQIVMNQFDLALFDTMAINITKKQFKEMFGPQRRPSKEDFIYFCDLNRMFQVDHSQQFRNFNNSAIYYKLILKKYTQKANIQAGTEEIKNKMEQLTQNSTINELFGVENNETKAAIANKPQFTPLTRDPIRLEYKATIDKELIENSSTIISKSHYDLSSINQGIVAVKYNNFNSIMKISDNIGYQIWFKINNYITNDIYNFMNYYDNDNLFGWKVNLVNDSIQVTLGGLDIIDQPNQTTYNFDLLGYSSDQNIALEEDVWYCYVLNVNQRQRNMEQFIYKRNVEFEDDAANLSSTILKQVYKNTQDIIPIKYETENITCEILGSDMLLTNIRLFTDIIPEDEHTKICNQYIIRDDSKYLVFADNATTRLILPRYPLFE